jgi:hypothetical protein
MRFNSGVIGIVAATVCLALSSCEIVPTGLDGSTIENPVVISRSLTRGTDAISSGATSCLISTRDCTNRQLYIEVYNYHGNTSVSYDIYYGN